MTDSVQFSGDVARDVPAFLIAHDCPGTAAHCRDVAAEAHRVALIAGVSPDSAEIAGWLHDVSAIFPNGERIAVARSWNIDVLPEEAAYPMIIHQKLSARMAQIPFGIADAAILSAIRCHTTLSAGSSALDRVVFVADKLAWDQPGVAPFHAPMRDALAKSLDQAVVVYLRHLWENRASLPVVHPWFRDACIEFGVAVGQ